MRFQKCPQTQRIAIKGSAVIRICRVDTCGGDSTESGQRHQGLGKQKTRRSGDDVHARNSRSWILKSLCVGQLTAKIQPTDEAVYLSEGGS